jgi:hypothetical protein
MINMEDDKNLCPFFIDGSFDQLGPVYRRTRSGLHCAALDGRIYIPYCTNENGPRKFGNCPIYGEEIKRRESINNKTYKS